MTSLIIKRTLFLSLVFSSTFNFLSVSSAIAGFQEELQQALKDSNFEKILKLSNERLKSVKKDSLDASEAELAEAIALKHLGFTFGATGIIGNILKNKLGTDVANRALSELSDIVRSHPVDEEYVFGELLNDLEFDNVVGENQDFVAFAQGMYNQQKGFAKWSEQDFKKITIDSYWDFRLKYLTALGDIAHDRIDSAIEHFSAIANSQTVAEDLKSSALHQYARLLFEKGDYPKAYKIFKQVKLNPREKGLILLERAWTKYYQKDYSKALGLLSALESPLFDTSRSPEPYILKMVMYKELCYYDAAENVLHEYQHRFGTSLEKIRGRKDLRKDQIIVNLSLLDQRLEKWVNLLNEVKDEKTSLTDHSWTGYPFFSELKRSYSLKINEVSQRLDWLLLDKTRAVANDLLDWQEQLTFLDYQTRLDSLRVIRAQRESNYKTEEIPHLTFDRIFWVNQGEYWLDELEDLKVFVQSKCSDDATEASK
jgi:hypothetical protein